MLSGRLAWVTGGGRGLGQTISQVKSIDLFTDVCHNFIITFDILLTFERQFKKFCLTT